jgi:hypothetical protein
MKYFYFIILVLTTQLMANTGFICKNQNLKIARQEMNSATTIVVTNTQDGSVEYNQNLVLPMEQTTEAYQERFGTYYIIMEHAQTHIPFGPDFLMIYRLNQMTNLFKKGFKAFEGNGKPVELNKLYCTLLKNAILEF